MLITADVRSDMMLAPVAGLSRISNYGVNYTINPPPPPGLLSQSYQSNTNGTLLGAVDPRSGTGFNVDSLLLYNLQGLDGISPSLATLSLRVDSALVNNFSNLSLYDLVTIKVAGTDDATLGPGDYAAPPVMTTSINIPTGIYNGTDIVNVDLTSALQKLVAEGFDSATVLLQTAATTSGPSQVNFTQAPTLDITPDPPALPEPSSIVSLGISLAGLILYKSLRK